MKQKKLVWPWILCSILFVLVLFLGLNKNQTSEDALARLEFGQDLETVKQILDDCHEDYQITKNHDGSTSFYFGGASFLEELISEQTFYWINVNETDGLTKVISEIGWLTKEHSHKTLIDRDTPTYKAQAVKED